MPVAALLTCAGLEGGGRTREWPRRLLAYNEHCVYPEDKETGGFPRSVDDLQWLVSGETGYAIWHGELQIKQDSAKFHSFYVPKNDQTCRIYYAPGLDVRSKRYFRAKELMQLLLMREDLLTTDIVDLVHKSIIKASPEGQKADLGLVVASDTIGDVAAMEFFFPHAERMLYIDQKRKLDYEEAGKRYGIPNFVIQRCFNNMEISKKYFGGGQEA